MEIANYIRRQKIYSIIFIFVGVIALILGDFFGYEKSLMLGISLGCIPLGIFSIIVYSISEKKKGMLKNIELENEERNIFINSKAAQKAFWISYFYMVLVVVLKRELLLSLDNFLIITLIFMPIVYFLLVIIYHKRY
ncbi:hypothetical protein [Clostridium felsineum]|uniref:hypothetical protein n=1 Tax=Clostridium felsineum TaxID=36839 RepID=UPI00098C1505|nr:hypothetical protein [Clostridium felsineum]URZ17085.1 hypothetical protein CLFE_031370 [Clostridium felsineum DSM 794]